MVQGGEIKSSSVQRFHKAYPKEEYVASERALTNDATSGTITLPIYLQNIGDNAGNKSDSATICTIPFHLENNFSFSLGNSWQPLVPTDILEEVSSIVNGLQLVTPKPGTQISFLSKQMQLAMWRGSEQPRFSVDMTFVCTQRNYNPVNIITALCEAALPRDFTESKNQKAVETRDGSAQFVENMGKNAEGTLGGNVGKSINLGAKTVADGIRNSGLMAPLFYSARFENGQSIADESCTLTLQIGRWFRASKLIVENISNIEFSKEVIAPPLDFSTYGQSTYTPLPSESHWGFPLYAKCTMTLRPINYITAEDFMQYFIPTANT